MPKPTPSCDIFCRVVDNYGDAAVCWRLAAQLAAEHAWQVRLWIDDPTPLRQLVPDLAGNAVDVRTWPQAWLPVASAEIVIEAFACELPAAYIEAMATSSRPPVWLNLEYLSAESWVAGCHLLPSPHPRLPLVKHFFFPGFGPDTGGLIRERDYDSRREDFDQAAFRAEFGLPPKMEGELTISLFSYENPVLPELLQAWATPSGSSPPIRLLRPGSRDAFRAMGKLSIHSLPFLPQRRYDELLWACDLNFVRGEDSFVRAQWAAKPFVWQIYPQDGDAHHAKLDAFLAVHPSGEHLRSFWKAWNGRGAVDWPGFSAALPTLGAPLRQWENHLRSPPDLASQLVKFCLERLK